MVTKAQDAGEIYLETRIWSGSPHQAGVPLLSLCVLCSKPLHSLNVPPTCLPFLLWLLTQIYLLAILSAKSVLLSLNLKKKKKAPFFIKAFLRFLWWHSVRICLLMQKTWVQFLVQKDSTCHRATKPPSPPLGPQATTTEACMPRPCALQQEKPLQ